MSTWDAVGFSGQYEMDTADICSKTGPRGGILMLMPNQLSWWAGADMCRRWANTGCSLLGYRVTMFTFWQIWRSDAH